MKLLFQFLSITLIFSVYGCSDQGDCGCTIIDATIDFSVKSLIDGSDLLSPDTEGFYRKDQIKLFDLVDGEILPLSLPSGGELDNQSGFDIFVDSLGLHRMTIFANIEGGNGIKSNVIKWNDTESDTLSYEVLNRTSSNVGISRVWFNDEEVWNGISQTPRYFIIEK